MKSIVFNGEIYNYRDIRESLVTQGYSFASRGDAEVVLNAFDSAGPSCLNEFHGMYAFAIWDDQRHSLFLARDRFGIKPLYYYFDGQHFLFASEIKALLRHPAVSATIDEEALDDYLSYGYVPHDEAIIRGIRKLPAAHWLTFEAGRITIQKYWEPEYRPIERSGKQTEEELRERLRESVRLWSVSDVPVGVFLSGGLDSSTVCALMAGRSGEQIRSYTISFDGERSDESPWARMIAARFGTAHHERRVTIEDARRILPRLAAVYDEPFFDTSAIPMLHVAAFAREQVKVVLAGDGGDELFFGYGWYSRFLEVQERYPYRPTLRSAFLGAAAPLYRRLPGLSRLILLKDRLSPDPVARYFRLTGFFDDWERNRLRGGGRGDSGRDCAWLFRRFYRPDLPAEAALRLLDMRTYLVDDILTKVDRAGMAHSLEVRTPLLEHSLAEFVMSIPVEQLCPGGARKHLLKRAAEPLLPPEIVSRKKQGFSAPVRFWLRGDLDGVVRDRLFRGHAVRDGIFDPRAIRAMLRTIAPNRWAKLWMLLMFEGWYRRWILGMREEEAPAAPGEAR